MSCFLCLFEIVLSASKILHVYVQNQALMQHDFSKKNSVREGHSLKNKNGKLSICLHLSDGINIVWIERKQSTRTV